MLNGYNKRNNDENHNSEYKSDQHDILKPDQDLNSHLPLDHFKSIIGDPYHSTIIQVKIHNLYLNYML